MWTDEKLALLEQYVIDEALSFAEAGSRLGKSKNACIGAWKRLQAKRANPHPVKDRIWPPERVDQLRRHIEVEGLTRMQASRVMGLTYNTVNSMCYRLYGSTRERGPNKPEECPSAHPFVQESGRVPWEEVQKRLQLRAPDRRDLTGKLLGDPRPGESALDRKSIHVD